MTTAAATTTTTPPPPAPPRPLLLGRTMDSFDASKWHDQLARLERNDPRLTMIDTEIFDYDLQYHDFCRLADALAPNTQVRRLYLNVAALCRPRRQQQQQQQLQQQQLQQQQRHPTPDSPSAVPTTTTTTTSLSFIPQLGASEALTGLPPAMLAVLESHCSLTHVQISQGRGNLELMDVILQALARNPILRSLSLEDVHVSCTAVAHLLQRATQLKELALSGVALRHHHHRHSSLTTSTTTTTCETALLRSAALENPALSSVELRDVVHPAFLSVVVPALPQLRELSIVKLPGTAPAWLALEHVFRSMSKQSKLQVVQVVSPTLTVHTQAYWPRLLKALQQAPSIRRVVFKHCALLCPTSTCSSSCVLLRAWRETLRTAPYWTSVDLSWNPMRDDAMLHLIQALLQNPRIQSSTLHHNWNHLRSTHQETNTTTTTTNNEPSSSSSSGEGLVPRPQPYRSTSLSALVQPPLLENGTTNNNNNNTSSSKRTTTTMTTTTTTSWQHVCPAWKRELYQNVYEARWTRVHWTTFGATGWIRELQEFAKRRSQVNQWLYTERTAAAVAIAAAAPHVLARLAANPTHKKDGSKEMALRDSVVGVSLIFELVQTQLLEWQQQPKTITTTTTPTTTRPQRLPLAPAVAPTVATTRPPGRTFSTTTTTTTRASAAVVVRSLTPRRRRWATNKRRKTSATVINPPPLTHALHAKHQDDHRLGVSTPSTPTSSLSLLAI